MKVASMRRIDKWLGTPVCFLLTIVRRLFEPRRRQEVSQAPRRLLFVKLAEQGSTVLAQGALRRAIERVGRDNVYFLLFAENRAILDLMGLIPTANVIAIQATSLPGAIVSAIAALWKMWQLGIDEAVDLEFFARSSAALCYLSGARHRAGYHAFGGEASFRGDLMTHRVSFNPYLHTSQTFQVLVEALDVPPAKLPTFAIKPPAIDSSLRFEPSAEEIAEVRDIVRQQLGRPCPSQIVLLNSNASDLLPLRRWPDERYVDLARSLLATYPDAHVCFTGAPSEQAAAEGLVGRIGSPRCFSMAGKTTLRQLMALYHIADVLVTNDSGPAHFASLTPIDIVVLFGPETPLLFAARSPRTHPLWAGLVCSPCINAFNNRNSACTDNVCMRSITVAQVFTQVCRLHEARYGKLRISA